MSRKRPASPLPALAPAMAAAAASHEVVVAATDARSDSDAASGSDDDFSDIEDKPVELDKLRVSTDDLPTAVTEFADGELIARVFMTALRESALKLEWRAVAAGDACERLKPHLYHTTGGDVSDVVWDHARRAKREAKDTHSEALRLAAKLQNIVMNTFC